MMDNEVVNQRQWMSREKLLDLLGITNLIPGPNSTELAIHIGYERGGWRGLLIAGSCFILPAMLIVWALLLFMLATKFLNPMAAVWHQACDCDRASGALEAGQKLLKTPPQLQESWQWRLTSLD